jgi:glycosyltransferase involved in cell wall biosynthesis
LKKFKYDVTVVIPVYNVEEYLRECIESLLHQEYDLQKIEIILIDDGSIDNSLNICKEYAHKYNNIKLLSQKNSGVSTARNKGIKSANGKYIMLLDSDDTISKNAIKHLFDFFEKHYEDVDIVTYPIKFNRHGQISDNIRYRAYDKGTNIYDVNEYIYLNQSTVNIMIKNEYEKTNLYDVNMKLSEDQNFDTELIMKKEKIGYVQDAIYYYRKYDASVSASKNNPYYCFDDIMNYNEMLLTKYTKNGKVPKYIQSLVINTIKWRIRTDELFPYYLEGKKLKEAEDRIKNIVNQIDIDVMMGVVDMNFYHKVYLLKFANRNIYAKVEDKINIYCENEIIRSYDNIDGMISRIKLKNGKLYLMADILNPLFDSLKPDVYIEKTTKDNQKITEKIRLQNSNESYHLSKIKVLNAYGFDISFDIKNIKSFKIYIEIDGRKIDISFKFKRFASNNYIKDKKNILYARKELCFKIRNANILNIMRSRFRKFRKLFKKNKKAILYRIMYYFTIHKKNIWIYTDRGDTTDNAYIQFQHDMKKHDGIRRYYICRFKENELQKYFTKEQRKHVIKQNSLKHKMLFLTCDKIITSFVDLQVYCPFNTSISYYNDLTKYDLIYLQHGMLHANLIKMYSKEFTEISKFVISSSFEEKNLTEKYHYQEEDFIKSGMPRESLKKKNVKVKNKILYAPSWRAYLIGRLVKNKRALKENEFLNSSYFKETYNFLHSQKLNDFLTKNNYILDFQLHPIFREYAPLFEVEKCKNIHLKSGNTVLEEYKMFITDFSSFQFDYISLKRPIAYFVPDMVEFKAGLHSYRELDLKYEDAFGKLCLTSEELIKEILSYEKTDFKVKKIYEKRMNDFFYEIKNPCEKIYTSLKR